MAIRFAKVHEVELDDGRTVHFKDLTMATVGNLTAFEESGHKDFGALCGVLLDVMVEADGKPLKDFEGLSADDLVSMLPAEEAMKLFTAFGDLVQQGNE